MSMTECRAEQERHSLQGSSSSRSKSSPSSCGRLHSTRKAHPTNHRTIAHKIAHAYFSYGVEMESIKAACVESVSSAMRWQDGVTIPFQGIYIPKTSLKGLGASLCGDAVLFMSCKASSATSPHQIYRPPWG